LRTSVRRATIGEVSDAAAEPSARVQQHEIDAMRRSLAIGGALTRSDAERLLETCGELLAERVRIQRVLAQLGPAWGGTRRALNDLAKIVHR
jgi:hypothetical protein